jgi:LacI family transcriptional regulator
VVFVDRFPNRNDIHKVHINNFNAAFEATEHLIGQGCRRIAHIGGGRHQSIYEDRLQGYVAALRKNNLLVEESLIILATSLSTEEGMRLTGQLLDSANPPDGIFCANDTTGVSAIRCAKSRGIKIPESLSIIGFNDDPICEIIDPPLSSIHHPAIEMGKATVRQALAILAGKLETESTSSVTLDTHVVARASSGRLGAERSKDGIGGVLPESRVEDGAPQAKHII